MNDELVPAPALYVLTSMVDDWAGYGPAVIQWVADERHYPPLAWSLPDIVADHADLTPSDRVQVARAVEQFFSRTEAFALGQYLRHFYPVRFGVVELPVTASEALAMQAPNPIAMAQTLWRIQPSREAAADLPFSFQGIVSLWPWPGLVPDDIASLIAMRERLGLDPVPPAPTSLSPAPEEES